MNLRNKKIFSIIFAILIGIGIVFFAWRSGHPAKEKVDIATDSSWKDSLAVVPQTSPSKTLGASSWDLNPTNTESTTTTNLIAQKMLVEYIASVKNTATTTLSDTEANRIANVLLQDIPSSEEKQYTLSDLNISQDNSHTANLAYINKVNALTKDQFATDKKENDEVAILVSALNTDNPALLNKLSITVNLYQKLVKDLLAVKTPSSVASIHLQLVEDCEFLRSAIAGFQSSMTDPMAGVQAISKYKSGMDDILIVMQEYRDFYANF